MSIKDRLKMFDPKYRENANNPQPPRNHNKKLLPKSKYISKENDLSIYQYPIIEFSDLEKFYCKNILILGINQMPFIENLINFCCDISYEDDIRYKPQSVKENNIKPFSIYNIKGMNCIRIISFPDFNSKNYIFNDEKTFISLLRIFEQITSKIDYVFFLYDDEILELNEYEKRILLIIYNLFNESLEENFIFLYNTKSNEILLSIKKKF